MEKIEIASVNLIICFGKIIAFLFFTYIVFFSLSF